MDEFTKAEKIANLALKEADMLSNERIAEMQMQSKMFKQQDRKLNS
jgi:hypothetical protein